MNENTGEIRYFNKLADIKPPWVALEKSPDADCWQCKGTGVGSIKANGKRVPCRCTKRNLGSFAP